MSPLREGPEGLHRGIPEAGRQARRGGPRRGHGEQIKEIADLPSREILLATLWACSTLRRASWSAC